MNTRQFDALVNATLDGRASDEQVRQLADIIVDDDQLADRYLELVNLHALLATGDGFAGMSSDELDAALAGSMPERSDDNVRLKTIPVKLYQFFAQPMHLSLSVAALVVGMIVGTMAFIASPTYHAFKHGTPETLPPSQLRVVATVTALSDVVWADDFSRSHRGAHLLPGGRLKFNAGLVELTFKSGAVVLLEGPAEIEIESESACRLQAGKLASTVPLQAQGFAVATELVDVVDLGTRFGVIVLEEQAVQVHVFKGRVAVKSGATREDEVILNTGQALAVQRDAAVVERFAADETQLPQIAEPVDEGDFLAWQAHAQSLTSRPDLVAYYTMEGLDANTETLVNQANATRGSLDGSLIAGQRRPGVTRGRWAEKRALAFNGRNTAVALENNGSTDQLGLAEYTINVSFMRTGEGGLANGGNGGIGAVPLLAKGFGLGDLSGQDISFILGIGRDGRLAADYEDVETGRNHPIEGKSRILPGRWYHASLTCDGREFRLYLNGRLEASHGMNRPHQTKTEMPAALGAALSPTGEQSGCFAGRIDEVAIFKRAFTAAEIDELVNVNGAP